MRNNIWNGRPRPSNGMKGMGVLEAMNIQAKRRPPYPGAFLPARYTQGIDITDRPHGRFLPVPWTDPGRAQEIYSVGRANSRYFNRFAGTKDLLHLNGVSFTGHTPPNWHDVTNRPAGKYLPVRWEAPASRSTKNLTKSSAQGIIDSMFTKRAAEYMGMGAMGVGAISAFNNARDGRYGRAAMGVGMSVAGYHLYKNPNMAAGLANTLLGRASSSLPKAAGMAESAVTALKGVLSR